MEWQLTLSLILVGMASCYLAWRGWRLWTNKKGNCGGGCACGSSAAAARDEKKLIAISLEKLPFRSKT